VTVPLSFTNIYETAKINNPVRRAHMARTQATISRGLVFRGRRRIFRETLTVYLAERFSLSYPTLGEGWFLSDLWLDAAADYSPDVYGYTISQRALDFVRAHPAETLFDYLAFNDEDVRVEAVRRYSAGSAELIAGIEAPLNVAVKPGYGNPRVFAWSRWHGAFSLRSQEWRYLPDWQDFRTSAGGQKTSRPSAKLSSSA
jgi:hypothetical protein